LRRTDIGVVLMTAVETERDVVELLIEQHDEIRSLLSEVRQVQGPAKQEVFQELTRLLAVHETAEEAVVHPVARRKLDGGDDVVDQRLEEEDRAKKELADLYDMGVDHPDFDRRLEAFAGEVNQHAMNEESQEFLRLRSVVSAETLHRMAGALKVAQKAAPTRPHPNAPESAMANVLAGPPMALFDRVRDAVRDWRQQNPDD
jgi:hemerythrin-like domain-containing protein